MPETDRRPEGPAEADAQRHMRTERTERSDGRYLIYYSWPELQRSDRSADAGDSREGSADV